MDLADELALWPAERVAGLMAGMQPRHVETALHREERSLLDLAALLSPCAQAFLEPMAHEARRITRRQFGRVINLYAPLYLSNACAADCLYCGFAAQSGRRQRRITLNAGAIRAECRALAEHGFRSVLLLTGEAPHVTPLSYIGEAVAIAHDYFPSVSIEMFAMDREAYGDLCGRGLDGVTLYMETYHRPTYARVHPAGVKSDYAYRLGALERAGQAGARRLNLGALLGLFDCRVEAFWMALHARHLQKACWRSTVALSFPRLRNTPPRFEIPAPVGDADLVQLILALRLCLPECGFTLSTRESAEFRDALFPLGVTMMSAGSSTRPGGYATCGDETLEQFAVQDSRSPEAVAAAIRAAGYDPVWKDFDNAFFAA